MKDLSYELLDALKKPNLLLTTLVEVKRTDGVYVRVSDLDRPVVWRGNTFTPNSGNARTAVQFGTNNSIDNTDIGGIIKADIFGEDDLIKGIYDQAEIYIFIVVVGRDELEPISLFRGFFGECEITLPGRYNIELSSITSNYRTSVEINTQPNCRAFFGDSACQMDTTNYTITTTIATMPALNQFSVSAQNQIDTKYNFGLFKITSGDGNGQSAEIRNVANGLIDLYVPFIRSPKVGDTVQVVQGCPRLRDVCRDRYDNILNFQGEPDIPGQDEFLNSTVNSTG